MKKKTSIFLLLPLIVFIGFIGCEGPEGPAGAAGPDGPGYPQYSYLGDGANTCGHCHSGNAAQWQETHHSQAYADLVLAGSENNPYCLQCHTVGFDAEVARGDTVLTDHGTDHSGFDDYWKVDTDEARARMDVLKGVQCENCHGAMGPTIYNHQPQVSFSTRMEGEEELSVCASCHHTQIEAWHESGHGMVLEHHDQTIEDFTAEWGRSSCAACHTAEGFIKVNDPDLFDMELPETQSLVGCVACHDPHNDQNEAQLRNLDDMTVLYDQNEAATYTGYGVGQLCAQCHHARRSTSNVNGQIENGYAHFGPHGSPEMDMFVGSGSYEIAGYEYDRGDGGHKNLAEGCVTCHMPQVEIREGSFSPSHTFEPELTTCLEVCHANNPPDLVDFDINGKRTEINDLMGQLITAIGVDPHDLGVDTLTTADQRMAGYAWVFVNNDASGGIHNYKYAKSLLENALDYIQLNP